MVSAEEALATLGEVGVAGAVVFGFPWEELSICQAHNDYVAEVCRDSEGRLVGLGCVSPSLGERGVAEAERCLDTGLRGIGEVAAYGGEGGSLESPFFRELARLLEAREVPLLLHATESVGHLYPGKDRTDLQRLYEWILDHPDLDIVLAHWGGGLFFYELMPEVREACRRVHYDTAASPFLYRAEVYSHALGIVGTERILLGSDFPLLHPRRYLREIGELGLPPEELAGLLGGNAARLWGVGGAAPKSTAQSRKVK
jgi:predicted TIM-barrel fold metal-dependent hydrolase